jgi:arginase
MIPTLLGLPFDTRSSFMRGAAHGPAAIRAALASPSTNWWSESLRDIQDPSALRDAGDAVIDDASFVADIERAVSAVLSDDGLPLLLGGDHSVTYPVLRAMAARYPQLTIVHVDAHGDLYPEFEGDRYSHACPFARILEDGLAARLVQIGIRTLTPVQQEQVDRYGVDVFDMRRWSGGARPWVDGDVYLSIDLDGFDPGFAPGVSHREPGGLTPREVIGLVQSLGGRLVGADVVELNPSRDPLDITAPLAAKLVKEIADRMLTGQDAERPTGK